MSSFDLEEYYKERNKRVYYGGSTLEKPRPKGFTDLTPAEKIKFIQAKEKAKRELNKEPEDAGFFEDLYRAYMGGYTTGRSVDEAFDIYKQGSNVDDVTLMAYIKAVEEMDKFGITNEQYNFQEDSKKHGGGFYGGIRALLENPGYLPQLIVGSFGTMIGSIIDSDEVLKAAGTGFGVGAAGGAVTGIGAIGTGLAGAFTGLTGAMETGLTLTELIRDQLGDKEFNKENIRFVLENTEEFSKVKNRALARGMTIGAVEGITLGISRGVGANILRTSTKTGARTAQEIALKTTGIEMLGGGLGEFGGQLAADQEIKGEEIFLEAIAEGKGVVNVSDIVSRAVKKTEYTINGGVASEQDVLDFINDDSLTDVEKSNAKINVIGNKFLESKVNNVQTRAHISKNIDAAVTNKQDRDRLVDLEMQRITLDQENKKTGVFKKVGTEQKLRKTEQEIEEIVSKYEGVTAADVTRTSRIARAVAAYQRDISFTEKYAELYDLKVNELTNRAAIEKYAKENNLTIEEIEGSNGFINEETGELVINRQRALTEGKVQVGNHELLHGILRKAVREGKLSPDVLTDLKNRLGDNWKFVQEKIDKGKYSRLKVKADEEIANRLRKSGIKDENGNEKYKNVKKGDTVDYLDANPDEYITLLSEVIQDGNITFNENIITKLIDFVTPLLRVFGFKKIKFETSDDFLNFLREYNKNIKSGRLSRAIIKATRSTRDGSTRKPRSLSAAAKAQIEEIVKEIGSTFAFKGGKKAWDNGGADNAIQEIRENGYFDDLIASKFKGDRVPDGFVDKVYAELIPHIRNFNPEQNDNLFGWINSQVANKAGNVFNREYKTTTEQRTAKDIDDRTKEGEVKVQVAAEEDARTKAFEEEDISPQARARKKQEQTKEKESTKSKLRQAMGIEDKSDAYNAVLETARKVLIRAYDAGKTARQIQRDLTSEASTYLFKLVKNMLGTKRKYIGTITKFRVPLINSMFTADLVQLERNVPDNERVFTKFISKLTSKKEVQKAVDNNQLPPSALNTIDKGQSVSLYEKVTQIEGDQKQENDFIAFFDQPLINPKTGARSGLRGTRKDQLAKYIAAALNFDATMQVAQEPEVAEKRQIAAELRGETMDDTDIQVLSATINRKPNLKFSLDGKKLGKETYANQNLVEHLSIVLKDKSLVTRQDYIDYANTAKRIIGPGSKTLSENDKSIIAELGYRMSIDNRYAMPVDKKLGDYLLKQVLKAKKNNKFTNAGIENENKDRGLLQKYFPKTARFLDGKGDTYINFLKSAVIFGFESKLGIAQGVSQLLSYTKTGINFPNKNQTTNNDQRLFDDIIGEKMQKAKDDINNLLKLNGVDTITDFTQKLSEEQIEVLKPFRHLFMIEETVSLDYIMSAYANGNYSGKNAQGFIIIEGKVYAMKTGNEVVDKQTQELVNEFNKISDNKIEYLKLNNKASGVDIVVNMDIVGGKVKYRLRPLILSENFIASSVDINNPAIAKKLGLAAQKAATTIDLNTQAKAAATVRVTKIKASRGMSAFDFDETLIDKGDNFIIATSPSGKKIKITSGQWPIKGPKLAEQGYKFDFTDFVNVRGGVDGPLLQKLRNRIEKYGAQNNYILTARPPESAAAIHGWLKTKGINIPIENITGLGNSTGEAKALWIADKYAQGYNDIYFVDDALPNVKAVADVIDQLDIKGKSVQAKIKFSRSMSDQFNDILEDTTGVDSQKRFSDVQANLRSRKGKYFNLVPPSAQDFMGLLYNFLGKGRVGERQFEFFKKTLVDPFAKGINELNTARQRTMEKYKELVKSLPKVKKQLTTELKKFENIPDYIKNYNVDQAVRVYLWNKNGIEVPGMTKRDAKALTEFVENNPDIKAFADAVGAISKEQQSFTEPGEYWLTENIKSDLFSDGALGDVRSKYLAEWQLNVDQIFSPENMNKIKVIYGTKFVEALQDVLYRMKTGRNRPTNKSRLTNEFMNWVNGSIGAIMFFNIRSAVLQTISSINYINWSDNNPLKAAAAFANQKQFWSDFVFLFNSDFLRQRRAGNQRGVNEQELSEAVTGKGAYEQAKAAIRYLLKIGFLPTQIADSFAIASGGATFYRNRVNKYMKDGMSKFEAENQAFLDFQEITEVSQQSARPDLISQQQADALGRMILSFQNTPMQYGRIMDKAFRDIINGRGDTKTHVSKIAYYGIAQGILFTALQSALFATTGDEDDEAKEKKKERMLNSIVDSWLSTFGYGGKGVATVKNTMLEYQKQRAKDLDEEFMTRPDHTYTILTALSFSPPIGSKLRKIYSSIQTERFNRDVMKERGFKVDNPAFSAIGNVIEAVTNLPLARLSNKLRNLENALDSRNETWQRVALVLGWNTWDLGIKDQDIEALGENIKERKKQQKKMDKIKQKYPGKTKEEIDIIIKEKEVFDLSKREQENIIKQNNLNPKDYKLEKDRVSIIMKLRNKNTEKIDKQLTDIKNYKPSKSEQREIDLFKMNKKDQVNLLLDFGLTNKQIKALKYEEDRVKKIIELEEKSKNR